MLYTLLYNQNQKRRKFLMHCLNNYTQTSIFDQYHNLVIDSYENPSNFFKLLKKHFDLSVFIPDSFQKAYYSKSGRNREFALESMLSALLIKHFLRLPQNTILITFLHFSKELRYDFCGFCNKLPDESVLSKFMTTFTSEIEEFFLNLVSHALPILQQMDSNLDPNHPLKGSSDTLIYDTSGVKPSVKENNPKFVQSLINKHKRYAKILDNKDYDPQKAAYADMPKASSVNPSIKLDYLNGHFGYFCKFGMLTNGFGLPLYIKFYDDLNIKENTYDKPNGKIQKQASDSASLKPILNNFFIRFPNEKYDSFLADSEFDSYDNFSYLKSLNFSKVFIPINSRNSSDDSNDISYDENGIPLCPKDSSLKFKSDGSCGGKNRSLRFKFICPKAKRKGKTLITTCENPCSNNKNAKSHYVYPDKDFRLYPGVLRNSDEWIKTYKIRTVIERSFASLKFNPCISTPRTLNINSIKSDVFLAASARIIIALLAYAINKPNYINQMSKVTRYIA